MELGSLGHYPSLKEKVVLITGGGSGIGAVITECFLAQGSHVGFLDIDEEASHRLVADLEAQYGRKVHFIRCDITDTGALQKAAAQVATALGPIDVLVNNAANDQRHRWQEVTVQYWDERMAINLRPMFFAMQAVLPGMLAKKAGSIVNIGSMSWKAKNGGMPAYTTAKAAVHGLTRGMARDVGKDNIRVNTVVPGWVMTERQLKLWVTPEGEAEIDRQQCLAGRVMPVDIARMVLFLAADDSRMCSAQEFTVDGGWV